MNRARLGLALLKPGATAEASGRLDHATFIVRLDRDGIGLVFVGWRWQPRAVVAETISLSVPRVVGDDRVLTESDGAEWPDLLLRHVRYEHLVRYVGSYSNRARRAPKP